MLAVLNVHSGRVTPHDSASHDPAAIRALGARIAQGAPIRPGWTVEETASFADSVFLFRLQHNGAPLVSAVLSRIADRASSAALWRAILAHYGAVETERPPAAPWLAFADVQTPPPFAHPQRTQAHALIPAVAFALLRREEVLATQTTIETSLITLA